jgi:tetratricopeptide (TPR) repeat protein
MAAGIPGVGIGGIFYLVTALLMPVHELWLVARREPGAGSAARWRVITRQWSIAAGILVAIWATGWVLGRMLVTRGVMVNDVAAGVAAAHRVSLRVSALLLSFGTLTMVLLLVQLARLVRRVRNRVEPATPIDDPEPVTQPTDERARARLPLTLVLVGCLALGSAHDAGAQDARVLRASAEQAYESGDRAQADRAYSALLVVAPDDSRALFRLGGLRAKNPTESARLYSRYVALEPGDVRGWLAYAESLGRQGRMDEALRAIERAERIAPRERDVLLARARLLARALHTDASIDAYERTVSILPGDAEALRDLAAQRWRAGRAREAIDAMANAERIAPDRASGRRLAQWRAESRMALEPTVAGTHDSDGNDVRRASLGVRSPSLGRGVMTAAVGRSRASDDAEGVNVDQVTLGAQWRPLATTRLEAMGGAARLGGAASGASASVAQTVPIGSVRARWRGAADGPVAELRVARTLLDATPLLVRNRVTRDEIAAQFEVPLASVARVRAIGRAARLEASGEENQRTLLGGALVRPVAGWGEIGLGGQRVAFTKPTTRGYFAVQHAELAELSSYIERESDAGVTLALDLGAGAQRITPFGQATRAWEPALRVWSQLDVPVGPARAVRAELDVYDGGVAQDASAASSSAHWRWGSLSLGMRLGL